MPKRELDPTIMGSIQIAASGNFDVKLIDIDCLKESPDNFFDVNRVEELADTILGQGGVKENLIVRKLEDDSGKYEIVSGHRRTAAVRFLLEQGESVSRFLPCLVQTYATEHEKNLDLILMNVSTRRINDAELFKSYEVINEALQNLKKDGKKFGQVQKTLAEVLGISTGQTAKLQTIDKYATDEVKEAVSKGEMSINAAEKSVKSDKPKPEKSPEPPKTQKVSNNDNFLDSEKKLCPHCGGEIL